VSGVVGVLPGRDRDGDAPPDLDVAEQESSRQEPVEVDSVEVDPVEVDPVEVDPVEVDPVEVDPVEADPVEVDSVEADPVEVLGQEQVEVEGTGVAMDETLAEAATVEPEPGPAAGAPTQPESAGVDAGGHVWSEDELAGFRAALDADIARLREELDMGEADLAGLIADSGDGAGDDQADSGSKTFEREHEMSVNANTREMLDQALRAQRRLEAGTYGICESCAKPIAAGRLRAFPRATLCITCKQAEERR
jgi:RNA polymerase-binding transcription factor DksA